MPSTIERVLMNRVTGELGIGVRVGGPWWLIIGSGRGLPWTWGIIRNEVVERLTEELGEL
jgi:hypothetical protein